VRPMCRRKILPAMRLSDFQTLATKEEYVSITVVACTLKSLVRIPSRAWMHIHLLMFCYTVYIGLQNEDSYQMFEVFIFSELILNQNRLQGRWKRRKLWWQKYQHLSQHGSFVILCKQIYFYLLIFQDILPRSKSDPTRFSSGLHIPV